MKILLVITKAEIGGAQAFVLNLATGLKKSGHEVTVAFGEGEYLSQELENDKIPFLRLKNLKRSRNPFKIFSFIFELKKIIDQEGFEVVHLNSTNTLPGVFSARLSGKKPKTVFTVHGLSVLDKNYKAPGLVKALFRNYFKFFLNFADQIVFVSQYNSDEMAGKKKVKNCSVIYNGLDIESDDFLSAEEARRELGKVIGRFPIDGYLLGSIGRLAIQKNYNFLIDNWPVIKKTKPEAKLLIIGDGPERKRYQEMIDKLNLSDDIFLPGELKNARRLLKGFDLFVLPSIYEGLSISLIEAVLAGIPALASDVGGNREVIGINNCFKLDSQEDFLLKLENYTAAGIDHSVFSAESMAKKYLEIYGI